MRLLRRVLYSEAVAWGLFGVLLAMVPSWFLGSVMGQGPLGEHAWVRILGVQAVGMALLMVMVAHRVETLWWFSWAFVLVFAGTAAVAALNASFSLRPGSAATPWWVLAPACVLFALALLWGIGRTGMERSPE